MTRDNATIIRTRGTRGAQQEAAAQQEAEAPVDRRGQLRRGETTTHWTRGTRGGVGDKSSSSYHYATINKKERGQRCDRNSSSDGRLADGGYNDSICKWTRTRGYHCGPLGPSRSQLSLLHPCTNVVLVLRTIATTQGIVLQSDF
jgi:hypothetical protein